MDLECMPIWNTWNILNVLFRILFRTLFSKLSINITWKSYQLGNMGITLKISLWFWKHNNSLGKIIFHFTVFQLNCKVSKLKVIFPSEFRCFLVYSYFSKLIQSFQLYSDVPNYVCFKLICVSNMIMVFPSSFCIQVLFSKLKNAFLCNCGWNLPFDLLHKLIAFISWLSGDSYES